MFWCTEADAAGGAISGLHASKNGESLVDIAGPLMLAARQRARVVNGVELVLFPGEDPLNFFGVTDPAQVAWMKPRLTPHPWKCFEEKLRLGNEAALRRIPQTHIACLSTLGSSLIINYLAFAAARIVPAPRPSKSPSRPHLFPTPATVVWRRSARPARPFDRPA